MLKTKNILLTGLLIIFTLSLFSNLLNSCKHDSNIIDELPEICFESQVLPIFQNSCALSGCHDEASAVHDVILSNYNSIVKTVVPGKPDESMTYKSITDFRSDDFMPPDNALPMASRTIIRVWIEQGAKNTTCPEIIIPIDTIPDPEDTATWVNPRACFERDILPILLGSCGISGCHDAITAEGERIFTDYAHTMNDVEAGNPDESDLYEKITESDPNDIMPPPPYSPLPKAQTDSIYNWILSGALNEYCGVYCDTSNITFSGIIDPIISVSCRSCHSGASPGGGVSLNNYNDIASLASSGYLLKVLLADGAPLMPRGGALPECKIGQIEIWINNGFPND
ncbi:MAG: hypothetical protein K9H49_17225 [Bacteroidales bacterium]|nr:hypothetical protein [Bacteroidales bacterium]MCF8406142.1 hypothetical protein [Bacteroidales bacterium]